MKMTEMSRSHSITGRDIFTGQPFRVIVQDGRIAAVEPDPEPVETETWLSPGFIDLQVNGYGGYDLNDEHINADTVISLVRLLIRTGTTTFLPTIITAPEEKILRALRAIAQARQADPQVAHAIPFVHLEGPHISPADGALGAHPYEAVRPPDLAEFARWQEASQNLVGMVTLSPHWDQAADYIAKLTSSGVLVAIGHTDAMPEQIRRAVDAGATLSTHLGNGIAQMLPRHRNPIWAQLAEDRLTATFIADGHHLPADPLKAMLRAKGLERSILVSDSVALAGMPPGIYNSPIGGRVELNANGRLSMFGTEMLAGAACSLSQTVAWLAGSTIVSLGEAVRMASENPGRLIDGRGSLRPGNSADLLHFHFSREKQALDIQSVWVQGVECH
jgi:N-acetylglucosamine-6-phosphate deacetylase